MLLVTRTPRRTLRRRCHAWASWDTDGPTVGGRVGRKDLALNVGRGNGDWAI